MRKPPKWPYVCSFHLVDTRPTEDHPIPEKWPGQERSRDQQPQVTEVWMHTMSQILMTMRKLKLNLIQGVVSWILSHWINTMKGHMIYIPWLPRETVQPQCFREKFPTTLQKYRNHIILTPEQQVIQPLLFQQYSEVFSCYCPMWACYVHFSCL